MLKLWTHGLFDKCLVLPCFSQKFVAPMWVHCTPAHSLRDTDLQLPSSTSLCLKEEEEANSVTIMTLKEVGQVDRQTPFIHSLSSSWTALLGAGLSLTRVPPSPGGEEWWEEKVWPARQEHLIFILCWFRVSELDGLKKNEVINTKNLGARHGLFSNYPDRTGLQVCTWNGGWLPVARCDRDQRTNVLWYQLESLGPTSTNSGVCHLLWNLANYWTWASFPSSIR